MGEAKGNADGSEGQGFLPFRSGMEKNRPAGIVGAFGYTVVALRRFSTVILTWHGTLESTLDTVRF